MNKEKGKQTLPFFFIVYGPCVSFLSTGKHIWNLDETLYANSLSFKLLNPHRSTTKDTGLELYFLMRKAFKGNNNS